MDKSLGGIKVRGCVRILNAEEYLTGMDIQRWKDNLKTFLLCGTDRGTDNVFKSSTGFSDLGFPPSS